MRKSLWHYRPVTKQKIAYDTLASTIPAPIGNQSYVVRLLATTAAYIAFGQTVQADIEDATAADPVVITSTAHPFEDGDTVFISGVVGMTEINGRSFTVANSAADTFELSGEDGALHTPYTSGGKATRNFATDENMYLPANVPELFSINPGEFISVLEVASAGLLQVTEMSA